MFIYIRLTSHSWKHSDCISVIFFLIFDYQINNLICNKYWNCTNIFIQHVFGYVTYSIVFEYFFNILFTVFKLISGDHLIQDKKMFRIDQCEL